VARHELAPGPGRPKDPPGFRALKTLTKKELVDVGSVLIKGDMEGLRRIAHDPYAPALLSTIASVIIRIHATGDMDALDKLLTRIIGKPRDENAHGGSIGGTHGSTVIVKMPSNGREVQTIDVTPTPVKEQA
jgi:hypothetical protein